MADDLAAWFRSLPTRVQDDMERALQRQAERVVDAQRSALQGFLQPPEEGGELLASLQVQDGASGAEKVVVAGGDATSVNGYDYAVGFALGTQRQPARDFFYAPYRALRRSIQQDLEEAAGKALQKA